MQAPRFPRHHHASSLRLVETKLADEILDALKTRRGIEKTKRHVSVSLDIVRATRNPRLAAMFGVWVTAIDHRFHRELEQKLREFDSRKILVPLPEAPYLYLAKGALMLHQRDLNRSVSQLTAAVNSASPDKYVRLFAWHFRGVARRLQYRYHDGIADARRAKGLVPHDQIQQSILGLNEAWCLCQVDQEAALKLLGQIRPVLESTHDPYSIGFIHFILARLERRAGRLDSASSEIEAAIKTVATVRNSLYLRCLAQKAIVLRLIAKRDKDPRKREQAIALIEKLENQCQHDDWHYRILGSTLITRASLASDIQPLNANEYAGAHQYVDAAYKLGCQHQDAVLMTRALLVWTRLILAYAGNCERPDLVKVARQKIEEAERIVKATDHLRLKAKVAIWHGETVLRPEIRDLQTASACMSFVKTNITGEECDSLRVHYEEFARHLEAVQNRQQQLTQMPVFSKEDLLKDQCWNEIKLKMKRGMVLSLFVDVGYRDIAKIARKAGVSRNAVRSVLREAGLWQQPSAVSTA